MAVLDKLPPVNPGATGWPWTEEADDINFDPAVEWPKISIVTPSYNQGMFIEETIRSVILQNYPNLEYIVIDGGSTDNTRATLEKYHSWITYWVSEPDNGQSHAINKGIDKCTGEIFNWINSDDWYLKDTFFKVATSFITHKSAKVVSGFENHVAENGDCTLFEGTLIAKSVASSIEAGYISQPSTFFRLSCLRQTGPLSESLHYSMDTEMWFRFLLLFGTECFFKMKSALVNFRFHQNSKTVNNLDGTLLAQNFLFERSSVVASLQKTVGVPKRVSDFWIAEVLKSPTIYQLTCNWQFSAKIIAPRNLRIYFSKRYTTLQFHDGDLKQASWGIRQLLQDRVFDFFVVKSIIKLVAKKWRL